MIDHLWIPVTLAAAVAQTGRNATQRGLTERLGTMGATNVRFLYAERWIRAVCLASFHNHFGK